MDLKEVLDLFNCKICNSLLRMPKHLPCNHDVCEQCLQVHIIRTVPMTGYDLQDYLGPEKVEVKPAQDFFICPADGCDNKYTVKYPKLNTVKWASHVDNCVRKSHFIELFHGKRKCHTKYCDACIDSQQRPKASVICTNCLRLYCSSCTFIHENMNPSHQIVDLVNFEKVFEVQSKTDAQSAEVKSNTLTEKIFNSENGASGEEQNVDSEIGICSIHRPCEEVLICRNCDVLCCIKCRDTFHVKCNNVQSIELLYKRFSRSKLDVTLKSRIDTLLDKCSASIGTLAALDTRIQKIMPLQKAASLDIFEGTNAKIEKGLKLLEFLYSRIKRLLNHFQRNCTARRASFVKTLFAVESDWLRLQEEFVKTLAVIEKQDIGKKIQEIEENYSNFDDASSDGGIVLSKDSTGLNPDILVRYTNTVADLRMVKYGLENDVLDALNECEFLESISAKSNVDVYDCWLVDCKLLKSNGIIVVDAANLKVKLISEDRKVRERCLETIPWGLAMNNDETECLVSLPDQKKMIVFSVKTGHLDILSEINTCIDICCIITLSQTICLISNRQGNFYLLKKGDRLEEVELRGLQTVNKNSLISRYPKVICNGLGRIYLSDFMLNLLVVCDLHEGMDQDDLAGAVPDETGDYLVNVSKKTKCERPGDETVLTSRSSLNYFVSKQCDFKMGNIEDSTEEMQECAAVAGSNSTNERLLSNNTNQCVQEFYQSPGGECVLESTEMNVVPSPKPSLEAISYKMIKYPTGLDIDQDGNIYICCNSEHSVLKLDRDRKHKLKILEIALPRALSESQNKLALTVDSGPKKNFIMMYKLKKN